MTGEDAVLAEDEVGIFAVAGIIALLMTPFTLGWTYHRLYRRDNPAAALPMIALVVSIAWIAFVLRFYADPSVVGVYVFFYFVLGLAILSLAGFLAPNLYGLRLSIDVYQRRNMAAAIVISAFALATGMIFGGTLWGEADPVGDDEGGWWIPMGFFVAGWSVLLLASAVYIRGEPSSLRVRVVQDRSVNDARAAASYLLGVGLIVTEAVAGDFWGWTQGLLGLLVIASMTITHQLCSRRLPQLLTTVETQSGGKVGGRDFESIAYAVFALLFWVLQRGLNAWADGVGR
ncbi:MAG TPA: hypothetical protein DDZ51_10570 [Planctomycetaceae bacterium]|nr:hypothetical protein [Planctomycetaceae bacterium]